MAEQQTSRSSESSPSSALTRRRFLQGSSLTAAGVLGLLQRDPHRGVPVAEAASPAQAFKGRRPNFLILMVDEMRYPPIYESMATKDFRQQYLLTQNLLRQHGVEFHRHYAASVACSPSRASIYTGHYPSLHGVTQTTGAAKEAFDPDVFWLDPNSVPTFGDYFRAAGYSTFWKGKWHGSDADLLIPGTHDQLVSYDSTGAPDPAEEGLYLAADRLDRFGFSGWIGPEPHGRSPLNSGSSAKNAQGRDVGFAQQAKSLIEQLAHDHRSQPWLIVASFVNPHDITLYGLLSNLGGNFEFDVEDVVPDDLFNPTLFQQTLNDNLENKPSAQRSYQESYAIWMQPVVDRERYSRFYYQLHKNVDEQMMVVYQTLLNSRYRDDTIVIFTSDHGDLLGSHHDMHQKWYTAYDEALRVPLIISNPKLFPQERAIQTLTSHVDLLPTLLGLAGLDAERLRQKLMPDFSDALPLVGRNLSPLVLGQVDPSSVDEPLYFMTDDDVSRGLDQDNWTGIANNSVAQPNHIEAVIARLDDGRIWKYARYFDNPQFWSSPGDPGDDGVEDVVLLEDGPRPDQDGTHTVPCRLTVKHTPLADEFEMYNVSDDPMELTNLYGNPAYTEQQSTLAALLEQQCRQKRLMPSSGMVPGQPSCDG
jgi:choline-sulfatase